MEKTADTARPRVVGVNERNLRVGESHPRAVLNDHEVELLIELRSQGFSYGWLSIKFEISKKHAWRICMGYQRGQIVHCRRPVDPARGG